MPSVTKQLQYPNYGILILSMVFCISGPTGRAAEEQHQLEALEWVDHDVGEVLHTVAVSMQENFESIRSWKGELEFHELLYEDALFNADEDGSAAKPISVIKKTTGRIEFLTDFDTGANNVTYAADGPTQFLDAASGRLLTQDDGVPEYGTFKANSIATADGLIVYRPLDKAVVETFDEAGKRVHKVISQAVRTEAAEAQMYSRSFVTNPIELFGEDEPLWKVLTRYTQLWEERSPNSHFPNGFKAAVAEGSDGVFYRFSAVYNGSSEFTREITATWVFSENDGFNPIRMEKKSKAMKDDKAFEATSWRYQNSDGVFVPSFHEYTVLNRQTGEKRLVKQMTLAQSEIGANVSPEHFSIAALNMADGDRFVDSIEGTEMEIKRGELVPIQQAPPTPTLKKSSNFPGGLMIANTLVALLLTGTWMFLRKKPKG